MRISTTHVLRGATRPSVLHEFDIAPICLDRRPVVGYDESVGLFDDSGHPYSGRMMLRYDARAIVWDENAGIFDRRHGRMTGDFVRVPVMVVTKFTYGGGTSVYTISEIPDDGIGIAYVEDCISIEINGRRRYRGDGHGSAVLILDEDVDIDQLQAEKEYSSVSRTARVGMDPIIDGEMLENEANRMASMAHLRDVVESFEYDAEIDDEYDGPDI